MKTVFLSILLTTLVYPVFSQARDKNDDEIEISICRPQITQMGRQSSFHLNYMYRIVSDEKGGIKQINELLDMKKFKSLMDDKNVIPCLRKWKLKPGEKYTVTISVGTSGDQYLSISNRKDNIQINL